MTEAEALVILRGDDPARAGQAEAALWAMWCRSGRSDFDGQLGEAVAAMERRDFGGAERLLTSLLEAAPEWAEAWNKRATVRYLAEEYRESIADCEETLARNPNHFGALSGQGLCHMALGEYRQAAALFMRTLAVHPNLMAARQNLAHAMGEAVKGNGR